MEVINIIEIKDNTVQSIKCYPIHAPTSRRIAVENAENYFTEKCIECGVHVDHLDVHLEDGYFELPMNNYSINIVWSNV